MVLGLAAATFLLFQEPRATATRHVWIPSGRAFALWGCMVVASVAALQVWRMFDYVYWFGAPALAAASSRLSDRYLKGLMVPTVAACIALGPLPIGLLVSFALKSQAAAAGAAGPAPRQRCSDVAAYRPLAALPPGVVLSGIDLGSHILANTPHSVLVAPYHRIAPMILAAHQAMDAPAGPAEAKVRALGADYIVDCPGSYLGLGPASLGRALRAGQVPPWLQRLSAPSATLQIYRVLPLHRA
jgi:hypothetical protein